MIPDCCTRAWAKATGRGPLFIHGGAWAVRNEEPYGADGPVSWVPKPTSAEWLVNIVEAADYLELVVDATSHATIGLVGQPFNWPADQAPPVSKGTGPDLRRALCAALNGKPCEREAA